MCCQTFIKDESLSRSLSSLDVATQDLNIPLEFSTEIGL
jgi:hypothetical protein